MTVAERRIMEIGPDFFPWLASIQRVYLAAVLGIDNQTWGWMGDGIEKGSVMEKLAGRLNSREQAIMDRVFGQAARVIIAGDNSRDMHSVRRVKGCAPIVSVTNYKLRLFVAKMGFEERLAIVRVGLCAKKDQYEMLCLISDDPKAGIN